MTTEVQTNEPPNETDAGLIQLDPAKCNDVGGWIIRARAGERAHMVAHLQLIAERMPQLWAESPTIAALREKAGDDVALEVLNDVAKMLALLPAELATGKHVTERVVSGFGVVHVNMGGQGVTVIALTPEEYKAGGMAPE